MRHTNGNHGAFDTRLRFRPAHQTLPFINVPPCHGSSSEDNLKLVWLSLCARDVCWQQQTTKVIVLKWRRSLNG